MTESKNKLLFILISFGVYLFSTGISYAFFTKNTNISGFISPLGVGSNSNNQTSGIHTQNNANRKPLIDVSGSPTETCPLNGLKYTKAERNLWEKRRPLAVMIENHVESRPQSGLSDADIVYEAVAEGGIARFMAIFYCQAAAYESIIGPIRSARTYFLDWASEYVNPLYAHVGGANTPGPANALGQIEDYGWAGNNDLNQFSIGYPTFWRDYERLGRTVATEHTMHSTTTKLWAVGEKRGYTNLDPEKNNWLDAYTAWKFVKEEAKFADRGSVNNINYNFWKDNDYAVSWQYDQENNLYRRLNGGRPHLDLNVNQQLTAKNVVVQFATERNANDGYPGNIHLLYGTIGKGKALIFKDGQAIEGAWAKTKRTARTIFYDDKGREISFNPGRIWISVIPTGNQVSY